MTCADKAITAWTLFNFPGRKGRYSDFIWNSTCFDGVDWDDASKRNGVYLLRIIHGRMVLITKMEITII